MRLVEMVATAFSLFNKINCKLDASPSGKGVAESSPDWGHQELAMSAHESPPTLYLHPDY